MYSLSPRVTAAALSAGLGKLPPGPLTLPTLHFAPLLLAKKKRLLPTRQRHVFSPAFSWQHLFSASHKARFVPSRAMDVFAGASDGSGKVNLDMAIESLRRLWNSCPEPVKSFPWARAAVYFFQLLFDLFVTVVKYLCIPVLGLSSLSEMSYCAHERKMLVIPIPFLAGIAVAKVLKETAVELSPSFKELEYPWHLLLVAAFFILLKLPGPYYPYWGRLSIPHFANGGLWSTLWFAFFGYRRPDDLTKVKGKSEGESDQNKTVSDDKVVLK